MDREYRAIEAAEKALAVKWTTSLALGGKAIMALAVLSSVIGGGLAVLKMFTVEVLIALAALTILGAVVAFTGAEIHRLKSHSDSLKNVLTERKSYEDLLRGLREERDAKAKEVTGLQADYAMLISAQKLVALLSSPPVIAEEGAEDD
jgi:hypothetical protein